MTIGDVADQIRICLYSEHDGSSQPDSNAS